MHIKRPKRLNKRAFTLFEILLVITLMATALGAIGFPALQAMRGEKFERAVDQVIGKLTLAQELMLDFQTDVILRLEQKQNGLKCTFQTHKKLPTHIQKALHQNSTLVGVEQISFDQEIYNTLELHYEGSLGATPQGTLELFAHKKKQIISLKGYPTKITRGEHVQKSFEAPYPEEILSLI